MSDIDEPSPPKAAVRPSDSDVPLLPMDDSDPLMEDDRLGFGRGDSPPAPRKAAPAAPKEDSLFRQAPLSLGAAPEKGGAPLSLGASGRSEPIQVKPSTSDVQIFPLDDSDAPGGTDADADVSFDSVDMDLGIDGSPVKPAPAAARPAVQAPTPAVQAPPAKKDSMSDVDLDGDVELLVDISD
jgi:hypothetical protein